MIPKLIRSITSLMPVEEGRVGECNNCGACCELPYRCQFLKNDDSGKGYCSIYKVRPPTCRKFPRSPNQIKEVKEVCGFSFKDTESKKNNS